MRRTGLWNGALAVLQASGVMLATAIFLPGVLVRTACHMLAARMIGRELQHQDFLTELGGEVSFVEGRPWWTPLFVAGVLGPLLVGSALLLPMIVPSAVLDVRPFAAISRDPSLIISHDTSLLPIIDIKSRFGTAGFLRLWFGASCLYCVVPPTAVLKGAAAENRARPKRSLRRMSVACVTAVFRVLRAFDAVLTVGFAGTYLASGLLVLLGVWWFWSVASRAVF